MAVTEKIRHVATKARFDARAACASLADALNRIDRLAKALEPEIAEEALGAFEIEFTAAFRRKDVKACRLTCAFAVKRFEQLADGRK